MMVMSSRLFREIVRKPLAAGLVASLLVLVAWPVSAQVPASAAARTNATTAIKLRPPPPAAAPDSLSVSVEYLKGKLPVAPDAVGALGNQLFGDSVNLFNGALSFEQTDVSLPGNNDLPVAVVRSYSPRPWWSGVRGALADWDLNIPRIEGTFSADQGFVPIYAGAQDRCSSFNMPPDTSVGGQSFANFEYWQGTHLIVPGYGSQEVLRRNDAFTYGAAFPLITRNLWGIGCKASLQNGPGEGFVATSPQGVRYDFDWMATRNAAPLRKGDGVLNRKDWLLLASRVTDRFGNWVSYTYDPANPLLLTSISSSDGRAISLSYTAGRLTSVFDGTRTWQYAYMPNGDLEYVIQPDGSRWKFDLRSMVFVDSSVNDVDTDCDTIPTPPAGIYKGTMWHPSGAKGVFETAFVSQARTDVPRVCTYILGTTWTNGSVYPRVTSNQSLIRKTISGPGMSTLVWQYNADNGLWPEWGPCSGCSGTKVTTVIHPDGNRTQHHFGIRWRINEGQLLRVEEGWDGNQFLRVTDHRYRDATGQAYPDYFGYSVNVMSDRVSYLNRPLDSKKIHQQGVVFSWLAGVDGLGLDFLARPALATMASTPQNSALSGYSRNETIRYSDLPGKWVLNQVASRTDTVGGVPESTDHDPNTGLPIARYAYGRLLERFTYWPSDGTLHKRIDAAGRAAEFADYMRGIPRLYVRRTGAVERADVNNIGRVIWHENAARTTTRFAYDAMGRLSQIVYPEEVWGSYHPTNVSFTQNPSPEHGLTGGHWRQIAVTGSAITMRWFDGLWRLRLEQTWDAADGPNTSRMVEHRYDLGGSKSFQTYPERAVTPVDQPRCGISWLFDGLGRELNKTQCSEIGNLNTQTSYESGFQKRVIDPRGSATVFRFQTFDTPSEDAIHGINFADGAWTAIARAENGQPTAISRGGTFDGTSQLTTRLYVYDEYRRHCKTIEPESGATVLKYDAASFVAWRASGQPLPSTVACDDGSVPNGSKVQFGYDEEGRVKSTIHGDGTSVITQNYTPDGLLKDITASRLGVNTITWQYGYNNRRKLETEKYFWGDPIGWEFTHVFNAHGHESRFIDPWGPMDLDPNALGEPRRVGNYASDVHYHANGALMYYMGGNGRAQGITLNARGLPWVWVNAGVSHDTYTYDANGNVTSILDAQEGKHRSMPSYDVHDRLRRADGPWGTALYDYDALDNLRRSTVGGRTLTHTVDPGSNRLTRMSGSLELQINYDVNGNVIGRGAQAFSFDLGNRLITAHNKALYAYDGHGRRNLSWFSDGTYRHDVYTQDGKLRLSWKLGKGGTRLVYLQDKLIAETDEVGPVTTYTHTDALGSPIAKTNDAGGLIERTRYEPYGATVNLPDSTDPARIGYTGHVNDRETGLVYMQQRHYDPVAGRFLSIDPVTTDGTTGNHFNRYAYSRSNPFRFIDPDGRQAIDCGNTGSSYCISVSLGDAGSPESNKQGLSNTKGDQAFVEGVKLGGEAVADVASVYLLPFRFARLGLSAKGVGEASSLANAARLRGQLAGKEIASGHAFEKHVLSQGEFRGLGIRTREQFANHIENVVNNPTASRQLSGGRSAYWQDSTGTVVIRNPRAADGGTAFQPPNGRAYFDGLR